MVPILYRLGGFTVYAYGFFIAVGFIVGFVLAIRTARAKGIPFERVVDLFFYIILSSILGSRILFVLTDLDFFLKNPSKILNLWRTHPRHSRFGGLYEAAPVTFLETG
jgi:phosphatidylglycerol:prolipoprotein diacylglycerol transferase